MRIFSQIVFDAWVDGTAYTPPELDQLLSQADKLAIHAVADRVGGAAATLLVTVEHSGDGRNFVQKNADPEINRITIQQSQTNSLIGYDDGARASLEFTRLLIQVAGGGGAYVRITVTGKTDGFPPSAMPVGMAEAGAKKPCCEGCASGSGCSTDRVNERDRGVPRPLRAAAFEQRSESADEAPSGREPLARPPGPPPPGPPPFDPGLLGSLLNTPCFECWGDARKWVYDQMVECREKHPNLADKPAFADCAVNAWVAYQALLGFCKWPCGGAMPQTGIRGTEDCPSCGTNMCVECEKWRDKAYKIGVDTCLTFSNPEAQQACLQAAQGIWDEFSAICDQVCHIPARKYTCKTKCSPNDKCPDQTQREGTGQGNTETGACNAAKNNAGAKFPAGCWKKHCNPCNCTSKA